MSMKPMPEYVERMAVKVQGGRMYIPVSARVLWFRSDHPDWGIESNTDEINHEKQYAVFTATIVDADGKIISQGTKKEDARGFGDYIEKAQTGAIGRALAFAGYGQLSPDDDMSGLEEGGVAARMVDSPTKSAHTKPQTSETTAPPKKPTTATKPGNGGGKFQRVAEIIDKNGKPIEGSGCPYQLVADILDEMADIKSDPFSDSLTAMWDFIQEETGKDFTPEQRSKWPTQEYCVKVLSSVSHKKGVLFTEDLIAMVEESYDTILPKQGGGVN